MKNWRKFNLITFDFLKIPELDDLWFWFRYWIKKILYFLGNLYWKFEKLRHWPVLIHYRSVPVLVPRNSQDFHKISQYPSFPIPLYYSNLTQKHKAFAFWNLSKKVLLLWCRQIVRGYSIILCGLFFFVPIIYKFFAQQTIKKEEWKKEVIV